WIRRQSCGRMDAAHSWSYRLDRLPLRRLNHERSLQTKNPLEKSVPAVVPSHSTTRRHFLRGAACGFGYLALSAMASANTRDPLATRATHFPARAKRVIFLFMQGGPSQVDTFDYKPDLARFDGEMRPFDDARVLANTGIRGSSHRLMTSPWAFAQHGESGRWVSELFPEQARHVDKLCFIHSVHTEGVAHGPATLTLHCGSPNFVRPSMGSWVLYGLGTENENLPGFVSIGPSIGNGGPRNYGNAFLPPIYQGTAIGRAGDAHPEIRHLKATDSNVAARRRQLDFLQKLNAAQTEAAADDELDAVIENYERA